MTKILDWRSGVSVKGLPILTPAARPPSEASISWQILSASPNLPVAVMSWSPRAKRGICTRAEVGLAPPSIMSSKTLAERRPVWRISTWG